MKTLKSLKYFLVIFISIQILFPIPLFADTIGKFTDVRGDVSLSRAKATLKPNVNDPVQTKDMLTTGNQARTKLLLKDDSLLSIGQNAKVEVTEFLLEKNKRRGIISVQTGAMHTKVEKFLDPNSKFEVHTPTAVAGARGTEWLTVVSPNPGTTIYALSQSVTVFNPAFPAQVVTVTAGNFTTVLAGAIPTVPAAFSPAAIQGIMGQMGAQLPAGAGTGAGAAGAGEAGGAAGTGAAGTGAAGTGAGVAGAAAGTGVAAGIGAGTLAAAVVGTAAVAAGVSAATGSSGGNVPATHHH